MGCELQGLIVKPSGVTTMVAATAVLQGPAVLRGPRSTKNKMIVSEKCELNNNIIIETTIFFQCIESTFVSDISFMNFDLGLPAPLSV